MVIITADDYGLNRQATDNILECFCAGRITSASAMVFTADAARAATLATATSLEVGLHLNFTQPFDGPGVSQKTRDYQARIIAYLCRHKFMQLLYNPFLADAFQYVFMAQLEEFTRLYRRPPDFFNGHHHMHLCANMLCGGLLPAGTRVRGTFTFSEGEKGRFNRLYRRLLARHITSKFISTASFFSILPLHDARRIRHIMDLSQKESVEVEVHPENRAEFQFLLSDHYLDLLKYGVTGTFSKLQRRN